MEAEWPTGGAVLAPEWPVSWMQNGPFPGNRMAPQWAASEGRMGTEWAVLVVVGGNRKRAPVSHSVDILCPGRVHSVPIARPPLAQASPSNNPVRSHSVPIDAGWCFMLRHQCGMLVRWFSFCTIDVGPLPSITLRRATPGNESKTQRLSTHMGLVCFSSCFGVSIS